MPVILLLGRQKQEREKQEDEQIRSLRGPYSSRPVRASETLVSKRHNDFPGPR